MIAKWAFLFFVLHSSTSIVFAHPQGTLDHAGPDHEGADVVRHPNRAARMEAQQRLSPVVHDGFLNEADWQRCSPISSFTQRELTLGAPATERTEVRILFDKDHLYIGVMCYDSRPDLFIARELMRDFNYSLDDNFIVVIDPYLDRRNGILLVTNPAGARADFQVFNNGASVNAYWNGIWDVRTQVSSEGWSSEWVIPLNTLRYPTDQDEPVWGINFERNIRRKREQVRWQGWSRDMRIEQLVQAGELHGLRGLSKRGFLDVRPYGLGGLQKDAAGPSTLTRLGGEAHYLITPAYRLNLTLNTDFAQVEADQQQVNLTRFPLFFPELRDFFLEGDDYFNFGFGGNRVIPFYTRRIGLNEQREQVPILGGVRVLGKETNRTLGFMSLQTGADGVGENKGENFSAVSWRQDVGEQSTVGAMSVQRISGTDFHATAGINGRWSTSKLWGRRNLDVGGALLHTYDRSSGYQPGALAWRCFLSYPNDRFSVFASAQRADSLFDPEVGIMLRRAFREQFIDVGIKPRPGGRWSFIRQLEFKPISVSHTQNDDDGSIQSFSYTVQWLGVDMRKGDRFTMGYSVVAEGLRAEFSPAPTLQFAPGLYGWRQNSARISTFRGRRLAVDSRHQWGGYFDGRSVQHQTELWWRANRHAQMSLRLELNDIQTETGRWSTTLVGSRIGYALNARCFGSLLTQWNSAQDELNLNFRFQYIPFVGADVFLIVNQVWRGDGQGEERRLLPLRQVVMTKIIWRFVA